MIFASQTVYDRRPNVNNALTVKHTLTVQELAPPSVMRLFKRPQTDLLTGSAPIMAEPFAQGMAQLYAARLQEVRAQHQNYTWQNFGAAMMGAAVVGLILRTTHLFGEAVSLRVQGGCHALIVLFCLYRAIDRRIEVQALGALALLSQGYEDMSAAAQTSDMATYFARSGNQALGQAQVLGAYDERLLNAARQYAARYNETFG